MRGASHEDPLSAFVKSEYHLASLILFTCDEHRHKIYHMAGRSSRKARPNSSRCEFSADTRDRVAKRAHFFCSICRALTVAASTESPGSVINIGVAAHITAASPGGPRYDPALNDTQRASVENAIWLCQTHAKLIDDDCSEWTPIRLRQQKQQHEATVRPQIGIPQRALQLKVIHSGLTPREYAFVMIRDLVPAYKEFLTPMISDRRLGRGSELGILMVGSPISEQLNKDRQPRWTVFVKPDWLRWIVAGERSGFPPAPEVPADQILGQVPGWPDDFFSLLEAIVATGTSFQWQRSPQGYLILAQRS